MPNLDTEEKALEYIKNEFSHATVPETDGSSSGIKILNSTNDLEIVRSYRIRNKTVWVFRLKTRDGSQEYFLGQSGRYSINQSDIEAFLEREN